MAVILLPHDPRWRSAFEIEARAIAGAFGDALESVHHIGSTAIPTVPAKPIVDILCVVNAAAALDHAATWLEPLGYRAKGENGIAGRRYFVKSDRHGARLRHLHVFAVGSDHITRHLAFRDYLLAHPNRAADYAALKVTLCETATTKQGYQAGKGPFIAAVLSEALAWFRHRGELGTRPQ